MTAPQPPTPEPVGRDPMRLHIGSGPARLEGWVNVDRQDLPEVDLVADVTAGLPVGDGEAEAVFAEHFLEHLPLDHALAFLRESHRVLAPGGWLRLTTPNLDWVLATQYLERGGDAADRALALNRGFYGWSHRFLWNRELLGEALAACGFEAIAWRSPGESGVPTLRGLERHERYEDSEELPHVLVVEGRRGAPRPERLASLRRRMAEFLFTVRPLAHRVDEQRSRALARLPLRGPLAAWLRERVASVPLRGHLRLVPEAPAEAELVLATVLPRIELDGARLRRDLGLPRLPGRLRRSLEERLVGSVSRGYEPHHDAGFRSTAVTARDPLHLTVEGELTWRGRSCAAVCELELAVDGDVVRARGTLDLRPSELGIDAWRPAGGLLAARDEALIELDVVATARRPT